MSISSVEIIKEEEITGNKIRINALTPIETHSTLLKSDGGKKTYYYSPSESEYSKLINENLRKKWAAYYREECPYNLKVQDIIMFVLVKEIGFDFLVYFFSCHPDQKYSSDKTMPSEYKSIFSGTSTLILL